MKKIQFFVGIALFMGTDFNAVASASPSSDAPSFTLPMDQEGCPNLKVGDPFLAYIDGHEGELKTMVRINGAKWDLSVRSDAFMEGMPNILRPDVSGSGRNGTCYFIYKSPRKPRESVSFHLRDMKKIKNVQEIQAFKKDVGELLNKYRTLTRSDIMSALNAVLGLACK